jgi:hypothetical protein
MRYFLNFVFFFVIISFSNASTVDAVITDTNSMLNPIPIGLIVNSDVNDSDVVFITKRCVVHTKYSDNELIEIEKEYSNPGEWEAFYDMYSFYNDDVSMYIYERSLVKTESDKKYIQFVMASGDKVTIDRKKAAGKLFFFNPDTGVKQCDASRFDTRNYEDF